MVTKFDIIVVGAGPAGATAARGLAKKGLKTLIIEKEALPRYKPCGGALSKAVSDILDFDYRDTIEKDIRSVLFSSVKGEVKKVSPEGISVQLVSRDAFDLKLTEEAVGAGTSIMEESKVVYLEELKKHVTIKTDKGERISCRVLIGADGAKSYVARASNLIIPPLGIAFQTELYTEDKEILLRYGESIHFVFGCIPEGYGWIFPKRDHLSVGVITSRSKMAQVMPTYKRFKSLFPDLEKAEERKRRGSFIPLNRGPRPLNTKRICLIGDAASLVDPLGGEGIFYAIKSGVIAGDIIPSEIEEKGYISSRFTEEINRRIVDDFNYARRFAYFFYKNPSFFYSHPFFIGLFVRLANKELKYRDILKSLMEYKRDKRKGLQLNAP